MKPHCPRFLAGSAALLLSATVTQAQMAPKTSDITAELAENGSATVVVAFSFDAGPWAMWKANVGDDPARTRASIRYALGAHVAFDDFKLERDDLNRKAKMTVHSSVGAELRSDGRYSFPIDQDFRLVNNIGRVWFFSGNVANTLSTIKVVLPESANGVSLADVGSSEQALTYALPERHGISYRLLVVGWLLVGLGLIIAAAGWLVGRKRTAAPASATEISTQ